MILYLGDAKEKLKRIRPNSVDAVVTDPPYGLSFMGKKWDYDVPTTELWREVFRVLKPGGHLLAFFGTRTYHRGVVRIEDAGFEIRDQVMWIYGSGFPKSLNIGKAIDKMNGIEPIVIGKGRSGSSSRAFQSEEETTAGEYEVTKANNEWQGWGTALKPANEPIVLARKPLEKGLTVAENVLKWGTGGLNIDACRIVFQSDRDKEKFIYDSNGINRQKTTSAIFDNSKILGNHNIHDSRQSGRWPANVIFDEESAALLDAQSGQFKGSIGRANRKSAGDYNATSYKVGVVTETEIKDFGGASRFFYVAKASKRERNAGLEGMPEVVRPNGNKWTDQDYRISRDHARARQNHHPTVKPIKLMQYLCKLITPPNGVVLDPFMGSGSTGVACRNLGFQFIGIELKKEYFEIAKRRIKHAQSRASRLNT